MDDQNDMRWISIGFQENARESELEKYSPFSSLNRVLEH